MRTIARGLMFLLVFGLAACSDRGKSEDVIRIGAIPPLSGVLQMEGQEEFNAAKLAVDDVNNQGGILGGKRSSLYLKMGWGNPQSL